MFVLNLLTKYIIYKPTQKLENECYNYISSYKYINHIHCGIKLYINYGHIAISIYHKTFVYNISFRKSIIYNQYGDLNDKLSRHTICVKINNQVLLEMEPSMYKDIYYILYSQYDNNWKYYYTEILYKRNYICKINYGLKLRKILRKCHTAIELKYQY